MNLLNINHISEKSTVCLFALATTLLCICMGCTGDVIQSESSHEINCEDACKEGEIQCDQNIVMACERLETGCLKWTVDEICAAGTHCDDSTHKCEDGCLEICDGATQDKCNAQGLLKCVTDEAGCAVWEVAGSCPEGMTCDPGTSKCADACAKSCSADVRCTDAGVESCSVDENGCAVWTLTEKCQKKQFCDTETFKCMDGCKNECAEGEKKCVGNGLAECKASEDGCFRWDAPVACETGKACNSNTFACEYACGDDCDPFSIILIPDTQNYSRSAKGEDNIYTRQMKWIKENEKKENIRAAIHLGDITEGNNDSEWEVADYAHKNYIDKSTVPYAISTGNHDYGWSYTNITRERSKIGKFFGKNTERFKDKAWFHESPYYGNSYITFSVGNIKFLVLALEFGARKDVVCWADELIKKYPDHRVIIETHNYLAHEPSTWQSPSVYGNTGYSGPAYLPNATHGCGGYDLYHELVARHNNVIMAVSGHEGETEWRQKKAFNGNIVTEMVVDYQFEAPCTASGTNQCTANCSHVPNAGNGWLRQLIFDPKTNTVQGKSITVLKDSEFAGGKPAFYCSELNPTNNWYTTDAGHTDHQFSFECDFTSSIDYKYSTNDYLGFTARDINSNGTGEQLNPQIAMHRQTGTMVTVWEDDSDSADGQATAGSKKGQNHHDIMGRIFYGGGCEKVKQFTVNNPTAGDQMTPAVAMDKYGNFVVVWADDTDGNGYYQIYMRGFDENGKERFATTVVNSKDTGQQFNPSIAMAPDGRFVVAWEDESDNAQTPQIFVRGFDANGKQAFADRNVDKLEGVNRHPSVAMADDGSFVVTWDAAASADADLQVLAKGFKADGTDRYPKFTVNATNDGPQRNPSIGMNSEGVFFIVYEDDADKNDVFRIKTVGYNADGRKLVADIHISDAGENAVEPVVCVDKSNRAIFSWTAKAINNGDIRFRLYDNYKLDGATHSANSINRGVQDQPALGCTEDGKFAILWHGNVDDNGDYEIFGHGYNEI
ncbi:MAG: metallophosphoesterase [Proteobacteria bacterium]|nr:metallophosphoesterase [Pseudomonadota bacterium]